MSVRAVRRIYYFLLLYVVPLIDSKLNQSMALHKEEESNNFCAQPLRTCQFVTALVETFEISCSRAAHISLLPQPLIFNQLVIFLLKSIINELSFSFIQYGQRIQSWMFQIPQLFQLRKLTFQQLHFVRNHQILIGGVQ